MPTYDYRCQACGHEFEEFQSMSAKHLKKCPKCGKPKLKRLIGTGAGIIFKGSGFYETDYRSEGYKSAAKAEKDQASGKNEGDKKDAGGKTDKSEKNEKKTESKAEPKSESKPDSSGGKGKKSEGK